MNKKALNEIIHLTQECITRFWQLDPEFAISYFDKNIVWIGSAQSQYIQGYENVVNDFRSIIKELKPCHLLKQEFIAVQNSGNACTVSGRYCTTTDDDVGYFFQVQQRCTFVWEYVNGTPKIKHCHISNPMGELKLSEGEKFANALGEMSKKYWLYRINALQDKRRIVIWDNKDEVHFLMPDEIVYVNAIGRNSIIHTNLGTEIRSKNGITDFMNKAGDDFSIVHRSFAVNNKYISRIHQYEIIMANGSKIPIPKKRYKEIRDELMKCCNT